jgi:hypothetical protein
MTIIKRMATSSIYENKALSLRKRKNVPFTAILFVKTSGSPTSIFWTGAPIAVEVCGSFSRIKAIGSRGFSPVGT